MYQLLIRKTGLASFLIFIFIVCPSAFAEGITREQGDAILKELSEMRKLLEHINQKSLPQGRRAAPTTAKVPVKGGSVIGNVKAPLTLVEFTDYQCPYCERFYKQTFPQLKKKYIDTGKVQLVIKDLPLNFHKQARKAAQASRCAGEQGRFLEMHKLLLANGKKLQESYLKGYAKQIQLNTKKFALCLSSGRHFKQIDQDTQQARNQGITGTPTFVLGKTTGGQVDGVRIVGAQPLSRFERQIDAMLKKK